MSKSNGCVQTHYITGIDQNYLRYVEIIDMYDTGEVRWFVEDSFDNTTPVFDNAHEFIKIDERSCMFLGSYNGLTNLFVVKASPVKTDKLYDEIGLEGTPKQLRDIDSKYAKVISEKGMYYFDKENLERSSDIFDNISQKDINGKKVLIFEKTIENQRISKKIIGTLNKDGKIGNFVYDESINGLRSTPKIDDPDSYDLLDTNALYNELDNLYLKKKNEKNKYIKNLTKINR